MTSGQKFTRFFALFCWIQAQSASAFIYLSTGTAYNTGARPYSTPPKWASKSVTFYVNTDTNTYGGALTAKITGAQLDSAMQTAIAAWNSIGCFTNIRVYYGGNTSYNMNTAPANVFTVTYDDQAAAGNILGAGPLAAAFVSASSNTLTECQIVVNGAVGVNMTTTGTAGAYDVSSFLSHEIGHCLGLGHTVDGNATPSYTSDNSLLTGAIMNYAISPNTVSYSPTQDERDSMTCAYPGESIVGGRDACLSYHGTNGGAALSGTVSGGPSKNYSDTCPSLVTTNTVIFTGVSTVAKSESKGSGCVTSAFASGMPSSDGPFEVDHWFWVAGILLSRLLIRRNRTA